MPRESRVGHNRRGRGLAALPRRLRALGGRGKRRPDKSAAARRRKRSLAVNRSVTIIREAGLFDTDWYIGQLHQPLGEEVDPLRHYVRRGWRKGHSPHPMFDPLWYRWRNPATRESRLEPFAHYLQHGAQADLQAHPFFHVSWYVQQNPEAKAHTLGGFGHYLTSGWRQALSPHPLFHPDIYLERHPDSLDEPPALHFLRRAHADLAKVQDTRKFPRQSNKFDREAAEAFVERHQTYALSIPDPPLVSIVLPTRNRADTIPAAIESVQAQTYPHWELIVVDDGSTDETPEVLARYATDERLRVIRLESSGGVSRARNAALMAATGRYIAYQDSDKTWTPAFLAVMVGMLESTGLRAGYATAQLNMTSGTRWLGAEFDYQALLDENYIDCVTFVHERSLVDEIGGFDEELQRMVDWDLFIRVAQMTDVRYAPFVGSAYDPYDPRPDRITNSVTKGWYWAVRAKYLLDWDAAAAAVDERVPGRTSIVIPAYGQPTMTVRCIEAVYEHTPGDIQVILVDNGGVGDAPYIFRFLQDRFPTLRVLRFSVNQMFAFGSNAGALASNGDVIVFLNNDTVVTPGWLQPLRERLDNGATAVQPLLIYPDGSVQCAGVAFPGTGMPYHLFREFPHDAPEIGVPAERPAVTAACMAVRARDVIALRGFDCVYVNGFEDVDFCLRLQELGPCFYEPSSLVVHDEGKTSGRGDFILWNRKVYRERWGAQQVGNDRAIWRDAGYEVVTYGSGDTTTARDAGVQMWRPLVRSLSLRQPDRLRWAIKIGAPNFEVRQNWGEYHFALALKAALQRAGHEAVVDFKDAWYRPTTHLDDVVLVLRGLSQYGPSPDNVNLLWLISHPDLVTYSELSTFDHVLVASEHYAAKLEPQLTVPVEAMLQATDPERFKPGPEDGPKHEVLFVGNSRKVYRRIVRDAIDSGLPLSVFGQDWEPYVTPDVLQGTHVTNEELPSYYRSAGVVLNDHWDDMQREGFLSNRLFDVAACGALILSDDVPGLQDVFGDAVHVYDDASHLAPQVKRALADREVTRGARLALARRVHEEHSFDARARRLIEVAHEVNARRLENATRG